MADNNLDFGKLDYAELLEQIRTKLESTPGFETFRESSNSVVLLEQFAAMTSLIGYYLQRTSEESFIETAKLKSTILTRARELGYVVARPIPSSTTLKMNIKGPLPSGLVAGNQLILNKKTQFTHNGSPYILKNSYTYKFTQSDIDNGVGNSTFSKDVSYGLYASDNNYDLVVSNDSLSADQLNYIELIQGEIIEYIINGLDNPLVGKKFQKYLIDNTLNFSNLYGQEDLGYDIENGTYDFVNDLTRVAVDTTNPFDKERNDEFVDYTKFYKISRNSLLTDNQTITFDIPDNICLIKTVDTGGIQIDFGDGLSAKLGPQNNNFNVYLSYLESKGSLTNQVGVIGDKLTTSESFIVNTRNITSNLTFYINSNIINGSDMEDIDSIKSNASGIYQTYDRLITPKDFVFYLKSLTYPINIKNAIGWGEQEESKGKLANQKLFNVALFTCLGEMYNVTTSPYVAKQFDGEQNQNLNDTLLDENFTQYDLGSNNYFNILVKGDIIPSINDNSINPNSKINIVLNKIKNKTVITTRTVYVTPEIQQFTLEGTVYLKKLSNKSNVEVNINNSIYTYLNDKADFNVPIYKSNILELIESNNFVEYCDISFKPTTTFPVYEGDSLEYILTTPIQNYENNVGFVYNTSNSMYNIIETFFNEFLDTILSNFLLEEESFLPNNEYGTIQIFLNKYYTVSGITLDIFWENFAKGLYMHIISENETPFANSSQFSQIISDSKNFFGEAIKYSMLDKGGNISNFSKSFEIPQITANLVYIYK